VDLQAVAHLAERERAGAAEEQQQQRLIAREREIPGLQRRVQARHQDLLDPHDRRHGRHRGHGLLAPVSRPLPLRLGDRVEAQARRPRHQNTGTSL
jgi:hypothetical protein